MRNLKMFGLASLAALAAALPGAASATAVNFSFDAAASSITVTENSRACLPFAGCALGASLTTPFNDVSIDEGMSQSFNFAKFHVSSGFGGDADARVEAVLAFTSPLTGNASTGGTASYFRAGGWFTSGLTGGTLVWDNPIQHLVGDNGEEFTVSFSNLMGLTFGADAVARVTISVDNVPDAPVAAVPEPATWAMMLAGFGLVGAGLRRRAAVRTVLA